jgi:hypothetical protein
MKKLVYIAGPYTSDPVGNTRRAVEAAEKWVSSGFDAFIPHLSMLWDFYHEHEPDFWYELDLNILSRCDMLYRMKGDSIGADREVKFAEDNNITIVYEI